MAQAKTIRTAIISRADSTQKQAKAASICWPKGRNGILRQQSTSKCAKPDAEAGRNGISNLEGARSPRRAERGRAEASAGDDAGRLQSFTYRGVLEAQQAAPVGEPRRGVRHREAWQNNQSGRRSQAEARLRSGRGGLNQKFRQGACHKLYQ